MQSTILAPQILSGLTNSINRGIRSTPHVSLYNYGVNTDIWEEGAKAGGVTSSKNSDCLYLYASAADSSYIGFETIDLIDISSFVFLNVLWSVKDGDAPYKCILSLDKDKNVRYRYDEHTSEGLRRTDFTFRHDRVDVTNVLGLWYCKASLEGSSSDGGGISKLNIHKIWLD